MINRLHGQFLMDKTVDIISDQPMWISPTPQSLAIGAHVVPNELFPKNQCFLKISYVS